MTASQRTLRLGIAGLGQAGAMMLPALRRHPFVEVTAGADPDPQVREAFVNAFDAEIFVSVEALARSAAVDVIYIATPTHLHAMHTLAALRNGKHVIIEKPMAINIEDATAMVEAAEANGVHLVVGHSQSFEPPIRAMRQALIEGRIGRLRMLHTWNFTDWIYRPRLPAELDTSLGGGVMFRQGAHQVDILRWIAGGMVRSVRAASSSWDPDRRADGSHSIFLEFVDGTVATAVYSGYGHFDSHELTYGLGEDGRKAVRPASAGARRNLLQAGDAARKARLRVGFAQPPDSEYSSFFGLTLVSGERGDIRQSAAGLGIYTEAGLSEVLVPAHPDGRDILLNESYAAIIDGVPPAHDGRWGLANLEVCLAALQSSREQREIYLEHQRPTRD